MTRCSFRAALSLLALASAVSLHAWDYENHRLVNQTALAALPEDFPAFVREPGNAERIAFLAGEPDRWRNVNDAGLKQTGGSWCDHFLDAEQVTLAGLDFATLTSFRNDFIVQFAAGRAAHAANFPAIEPEKNTDHTREWPGFSPWAVVEYYSKLKSAFSYLKVLEELGTPEEVANARANVLYVMGVMGHYVGDMAQPLHTTDHHNGWIGANPAGYTTWRGIHSWIDGGFAAKAPFGLAELQAQVQPARLIPQPPQADGRDPMFVAVLAYFLAQHAQVEPLYRLEREGKLNREGPPNPEGRAFLGGQLVKGGEMLGSIWLTAWRNAPPDTYLRAQLIKRATAAK